MEGELHWHIFGYFINLVCSEYAVFIMPDTVVGNLKSIVDLLYWIPVFYLFIYLKPLNFNLGRSVCYWAVSRYQSETYFSGG